LTLAACSGSSEAPDIPHHDAGMPATSEPASPAQDEDSAEEETVTPPEELAERRQQIEQEANQAFEAIMEETEQRVDEIGAAGTDSMQAITNELESAGATFEEQFDTIIANVESLRDDNMADEQKLEVVANARVAAETAARAFDQTDAEVIAAGDRAEAAARNAMGL